MTLDELLKEWETEAKKDQSKKYAGLSYGEMELYGDRRNDRLLSLIAVVRKQREALKQCYASTSVLNAIESENHNIKGHGPTLGGYVYALEKACEEALTEAERILKG